MQLINACDVATSFSTLLGGGLEPYLPPASYGPGYTIGCAILNIIDILVGVAFEKI